MSIKGIRLQNFRGFSDASIAVKPLTVLLGANSSGKSSFGHAIAALAHAQTLFETSTQLTLTPQRDSADWPVDLGSLSDLRKHGAEGPVYISVETSEGWLSWGFGLDVPPIEGLEVTYVDQPEAKSYRQADTAAFPSQTVPGATSGAISEGIVSGPRSSQRSIFRRINEQQWKDESDSGVDAFDALVDMRGLTLNTVTHAGGGTNVVLNGNVRNEIRSMLKNLTYLRATRSRPIRIYEGSALKWNQGIGYSGEGTARVLNQRAKNQTDIKRPPEFTTGTTNGVQHLCSKWLDSNSALHEALSAWLQHFGLAVSVDAVPMTEAPDSLQIRVTQNGQQPHDITEVGFGLSQLLPVLVAGLIQEKDSLFVVDLPEAHLHPKPQAALADFFCSLALSDRSVLVETHSEMFINQLRLSAEMTPELMDNIAIYFIDEPIHGHCSEPRLIGLGAADEMRWPAGFLQEAWDIESQISAIRDSRRHLR